MEIFGAHGVLTTLKPWEIDCSAEGESINGEENLKAEEHLYFKGWSRRRNLQWRLTRNIQSRKNRTRRERHSGSIWVVTELMKRNELQFQISRRGKIRGHYCSSAKSTDTRKMGSNPVPAICCLYDFDLNLCLNFFICKMGILNVSTP